MSQSELRTPLTDSEMTRVFGPVDVPAGYEYMHYDAVSTEGYLQVNLDNKTAFVWRSGERLVFVLMSLCFLYCELLALLSAVMHVCMHGIYRSG